MCSAVFWFGDLNYRLDEIDIDECKDKIKRRKLDDLWRKNDQVAKLKNFTLLFLSKVDFERWPIEDCSYFDDFFVMHFIIMDVNF